MSLDTIYPLLKLISILYFKLVNLFFWIINLPYKRRILDYPEDDLLLLSAVEAAELIRRQEITSEALIQAYISRIAHINRFLNAVVVQNFEDALEAAKQVDSYIQRIDKDSDEYKNLAYKKPFLGVPFTVKDSIQVEGLVCTVGIPARRNKVAEEDAEVVQRMRNAGAIVLAVTNVPECIMWSEANNTIYGRTNNPYDIRRTPGGSSGGEGALIAGAGSLIGIGSDVGGSIRIPSAFNGVFGLKPTAGIVPLTGTFPVVNAGSYRAQMWRLGPLCRYAKDLKPMLQVLADDKAETLLKIHEHVNFRKLRVFYMEEIKSVLVEKPHDDVRGALIKAVHYFEKKYDLSSYRLDLPLAADAYAYFWSSMADPNAPSVGLEMGNMEHEVNCYAELAKYPFGRSEHTLVAILEGILIPQLGKVIDKKKFDAQRDQLRREIIDLLGDNGILIFPSWATAAPYHNQPVLTVGNLAYTSLWNALSLPVVMVPMGVNSYGLPLAVQIVGAPNMDRLLIAAAQDLEEGFGGWTPTRSL